MLRHSTTTSLASEASTRLDQLEKKKSYTFPQATPDGHTEGYISHLGTAQSIQDSNNNFKMKLLTLNFLTCARKTCKSQPAAFPLHPREAELEQIETDLNPLFIKNILSRVDWPAMLTISQEVHHSRFVA